MSSEGDIGPWTDMYAVGALMWRMVAGGCAGDERLLVPSGSDETDGAGVWSPTPRAAEKRAYALLRGRPDPMISASELGVGRFSPALLALIDRCLALYSEDRVQSCGDMSLTLDGQQSEQIKSSSSVPPELNAHATPKRSFLGRLISGDLGLAVTYWVFGTVGSALIYLLIVWLEVAGQSTVMLMVSGVAVTYVAAMYIAIWRAANKYTGPGVWAVLARAVVVLSVLSVIGAFIEGLETEL